MNAVLGHVGATLGMELIKALWSWRVNLSIRGVLSVALKVSVVHPLLKKPSLDPIVVDNFQPVSDLSKVITQVVGSRLQEILEEMEDLDTFQSSLKPETALVTLLDDLQQGLNRRKASLLVLLDLLVVSDPIASWCAWRHHFTVVDLLFRYLVPEGGVGAVGSCSEPWIEGCRLLQASITSGMILITYMPQLGKVICGFGGSFHQYADNT